MSRIQETKRAYEELVKLLDQEIRKRRSSTQELQRFRESLDVAFYLLGWSQFEYLVRAEAGDLIKTKSRGRTVDKHAWSYLHENLKSVSVRRRLDVIFHDNPRTRAALDKDYDVRNEAAHNYKLLPPDARDLSAWLAKLEDVVEKFSDNEG